MRISDWRSDVCSSDLETIKRTDIADVPVGSRVSQAPSEMDKLPKAPATRIAEWRVNSTSQGAFEHESRKSPLSSSQIGRPLCRESVCPCGYISVGAVSSRKKKQQDPSAGHMTN